MRTMEAKKLTDIVQERGAASEARLQQISRSYLKEAAWYFTFTAGLLYVAFGGPVRPKPVPVAGRVIFAAMSSFTATAVFGTLRERRRKLNEYTIKDYNPKEED
jgi:hypothetical protein